MKEIILALIGSGLLSTLISVAAAGLAERGTADRDIRRALKMLLYNQLKYDAEILLAAGEADAEELKGWTEAFEVYKALGGDGFIDTLAQRVASLPIAKDGAARAKANIRADQLNALLDFNG